MKIFKQEIIDGVAPLVQANASVAYCSPAVLCPKDEFTDEGVGGKISRTISKIQSETANPEQIDLYYLKSVLVSTGWNKNDDVFEATATWDARHTPEDKQFNFMHDENDIIGHITGSYVVDKDGNRVISDEMPAEFDIITEAVLYNSWTGEENRNRMDQIIAEIEEGKWFVSMECLFAGFDYALIGEDGNSKLLARDEDSSFLTKHLRAYGGTGEYEGYKIGRSLRDISFSGKGLVSRPANPRSVILDSSRAFSLTQPQTLICSPLHGDNNMSDTDILEKQLAEVQSELASAKEDNDSMKKKIEEKKDKEYAETIDALREEVAAANQEVDKLTSSVKELVEQIEAKDKEMKDKMEELNKMKKEKKMEARKAALLDLGFEAEEAEESVASYESFDDETFEAIIAAMTKMEKKKAAVKKDEKEDKEKAAVPKKNMAEEAEAEEAEAEVAAETALEEVSTSEATLVEASDETDELEATRASVAQWLENNVLNK
jgi:hypothetical protein